MGTWGYIGLWRVWDLELRVLRMWNVWGLFVGACLELKFAHTLWDLGVRLCFPEGLVAVAHKCAEQNLQPSQDPKSVPCF